MLVVSLAEEKAHSPLSHHQPTLPCQHQQQRWICRREEIIFCRTRSERGIIIIIFFIWTGERGAVCSINISSATTTDRPTGRFDCINNRFFPFFGELHISIFGLHSLRLGFEPKTMKDSFSGGLGRLHYHRLPSLDVLVINNDTRRRCLCVSSLQKRRSRRSGSRRRLLLVTILGDYEPVWCFRENIIIYWGAPKRKGGK